MPRFELYGSSGCPYTREMREQLEWAGKEFVEFDVELDSEARARMLHLTNGQRMVPVLIEDGRVREIGWQGHGCAISVQSGEREHA